VQGRDHIGLLGALVGAAMEPGVQARVPGTGPGRAGGSARRCNGARRGGQGAGPGSGGSARTSPGASSAAAPGKRATSPKPSTSCKPAKPQDEKGSVPEGVLGLRPGLFDVAFGLVSSSFGAQPAITGEPAGSFLSAAFDRFGFMRDLLEETHDGLPFADLFRWGGRSGGHITGRDIGGGLAVFCRLCRRCGGLRGGGPAPEQMPHAALAAAFAGVAVTAGRAGAQRAGGGGAGGVALADQVVAVLADGGGLAPGLPQPAAGVAAAAGGAARAGQQHAQPEQGQCPDHDAVQEQGAGRAGHVIAEYREGVGERMPGAAVRQDAGRSGDDRRDQDDEPDNYDHDALRKSEL